MEYEPGQACIVGYGSVTALGPNAAMTAAAVRARLSNNKLSYMVDQYGENIVLALADCINGEIQGLSRLVALSIPAIKEAILPLRAINGKSRVALCLGVPESRPGFDAQQVGNALLNEIADSIEVDISKQDRFLLPIGHASVIRALSEAVEWIASDKDKLVLIGGVDSYFNPDTLEWLDEDKRLHSENNKDGFVPGEAAGFCLLCSYEFARRNRLDPLATVIESATAKEPNPFYSRGICIGQGISQVFHTVLSKLERQGEKADWVICDMNGESFRAMEWMYGYLRTGKMHRDPLEIWHPADCFGDIGAASGAVLACVAIRSWVRSYARGERCLIWTASDGEYRSAALLQGTSNR